MGWVKRCLSVSMAILLAVPLARAEPLALGRFSAGITEGWQTRAFEGETSYRIMELDGRLVLEGDSISSASSLYLEREIDLAARPVLEWSWRIAGTPAVADERSRGGDDFAARLYVVAPGRGLMGSPIAISYVWAGQAAAGDSWPNPFTPRVMMLALDSGNRNAGSWRTHRRNVQADFLRLFGRVEDDIARGGVPHEAAGCWRRSRLGPFLFRGGMRSAHVSMSRPWPGRERSRSELWRSCRYSGAPGQTEWCFSETFRAMPIPHGKMPVSGVLRPICPP